MVGTRRVPPIMVAAAVAAALVALLTVPSVSATSSLSLKYNTTSVSNGEWVRVDFSGVPKADRTECWIGLYAASVEVINDFPANLNSSEWTPPYTNPAPVKFIYCDQDLSKDYLEHGEGHFDFIIVNHRQDLAFWIFTGSIMKPRDRVKGPVLTMNNQTVPMMARLARTDDITEMRVSWTAKNTTGKEAVRWGSSPSSLTNTVPAAAATYGSQDLCGEPAQTIGFWEPGWFFTAVLTGLAPSTQYSYQVGDDMYGWTDIYTFTTAPIVGPDVKQRILITADMGVSEVDGSHYHWQEPDAHYTVAGLVAAHNASASDIIIHVGDIAYSTGYLAKWDVFMHSITGVSSEIPYMTGLGNHERDWPGTGSDIGGIDSGGECGIPAQNRFIMPTPSGTQNLSWWSINQGSIHLIMMATELDISVGSAQLQWIEKDLQSVNRSLTPWVVFAGHRPMYSGRTRTAHFGDPLEPILFQYKVDLCLWGHVHAAEVTHPVYNSTRITKVGPGGYDAPVHAVIGNGGQTISILPLHKAEWMDWLPVAQYWGWSDLTAENTTHLTLRLYHDDTNKEVHRKTIVREWPRPY